LEHGIGRKSRRSVDPAHRRGRPRNSLVHGVEHGKVEVAAAAATGRDAADAARAVGQALLGMEGALLARETLDDDPAALVDENAHGFAFGMFQRAAATAFLAASVRLSAGCTARPLPASISRACGALVPSRRTTTGTLTPTF